MSGVRFLFLVTIGLSFLGVGPVRAASMVQSVPWIQAGADPLLPFAVPRGIEVFCDRDTPGICESGSHEFVLEDRITFSDGQVSFEADFVSEVSGNVWTYGLANLSLSAPSDLDIFRIHWLPTAGSFEVPFDGTNPTTRVAIRVIPSIDWVHIQSAFFGGSIVEDLHAPHHFVATDTVTVRLPSFSNLDPFWQYTSLYGSTQSVCLGQPTSIADDCLVRVELSSVPEPAAGCLIGLGLLVLAWGVRTRLGDRRWTPRGTAKTRPRMPGTLLAAALALGLGSGDPAAAGPVVFDPVPWSGAGVGSSVPGHPLQLELVCAAEVPGICASGVHDLPIQDRISFSDGQVSFEADLVSEISGTSWTYGLRNLSASVPDELFILSFDRFDVFGTFEVPGRGGDKIPLVGTATPSRSSPDLVSALHGPLVPFRFARVVLFDGGDTITLFEDTFWGYEREFDRTASPCHIGDGLVLEDCVVTVEFVQPRVVAPEPDAALLGAATLAALALRWRSRRRR